MAVTQFGIVYSAATAQVRRYIYPTLSNAEILAHPLMPGEAVVACPRGPYPNTAAWLAAIDNAVTLAAGKPPGNARCCVIDTFGNVVNVIMADATIDSVPGMTLVNDPKADIGWIWSAQGGFIAPAVPPIPLGMPGNRP